MEFFLNTSLVVGLLYFEESKGNTIDKNGNIRAERPLCFWAEGQLINDGKIVICGTVKVNELDVCGLVQQTAQKLFSHIIVLDGVMDFLNRCKSCLTVRFLSLLIRWIAGTKRLRKILVSGWISASFKDWYS